MYIYTRSVSAWTLLTNNSRQKIRKYTKHMFSSLYEGFLFGEGYRHYHCWVAEAGLLQPLSYNHHRTASLPLDENYIAKISAFVI